MIDPRYPERERTRTQDLTKGLVGTPDLVRLYRTNVVFHNAVDRLVAMLPAMVEGLAQDAEYQEQRRQAMMRRAMEMPTRLYPLPGGEVG
jgi:hypothetical protein